MPSIEIVTHCWASFYRHYADALCFQLSSLVLHRPTNCEVQVTVCHCPEDQRTSSVLDWFERNTDVRLFSLSCDVHHLGRRAIGRDRAARHSKADFVWFTDVDHVFVGVLDRLVDMRWPEGCSMVFPREIMIHRDHATGDQATAGIDEPRLVDVDASLFVPKEYRKAIGGVQIVQGDFARKHGYLSGQEAWQKPVESPFANFRDDVVYRNFCKRHGKVAGVDLPGVFRIRHSQTTYQGHKDKV